MIMWKKLCHKSWNLQIKASTLMGANFQLRPQKPSDEIKAELVQFQVAVVFDIKGPGWTAIEKCKCDFVVGTKRIFVWITCLLDYRTCRNTFTLT